MDLYVLTKNSRTVLFNVYILYLEIHELLYNRRASSSVAMGHYIKEGRHQLKVVLLHHLNLRQFTIPRLSGRGKVLQFDGGQFVLQERVARLLSGIQTLSAIQARRHGCTLSCRNGTQIAAHVKVLRWRSSLLLLQMQSAYDINSQFVICVAAAHNF